MAAIESAASWLSSTNEHTQKMLARFDIPGRCGARRYVHFGEWQSDDERAALPGARAFRGNRASVQFEQHADQRQADSQAALRALNGHLPLGKEIEDMRKHVGSDADPLTYEP